MDTVHLLGLLENAQTSTIIVSVAGPNHYSFNHTFNDTFDLPLPVESGTFSILISAFTDGTFTLDVAGIFQTITPSVPFKFTATRKSFKLVV